MGMRSPDGAAAPQSATAKPATAATAKPAKPAGTRPAKPAGSKPGTAAKPGTATKPTASKAAGTKQAKSAKPAKPAASKPASPEPPLSAPPRRAPLLLPAALLLTVEAAGLAVAGVLTAADTAAGRAYQTSSGIAITVLEFIAVAGLAAIAVGVARVRPWSRTPALMTQFFAGAVAAFLLQAHRFDWGIPGLVLAIAGLAALLAPASVRALSYPVSRRS